MESPMTNQHRRMMRKRTRIKPLVFTALVVLSACSSALVVPKQSHVDANTGRFSDLTLAQLKHGKDVYENRCGMCHGLYEPSSHTAEQWAKIVPGMVDMVNTDETLIKP